MHKTQSIAPEGEIQQDKEILLRLLQAAYTDDALTQSAKKEFETFVARFDEEGMALEISLTELDIDQEKALRNLSEMGYTTQSLRYHGSPDGHVLHVNLRGKRFLEFFESQTVFEAKPEEWGESPWGDRTPNLMLGSGKREAFETGAVRDSQDGKSRPDLISPFALDRAGHWMRAGAEKYGYYNWQKGMNFSRVTASLFRHLVAYMKRDDTEDNLAAIVANACFLMHYEEMIRRGQLPESLDDLPKYHEIPRVHFNNDEPYEHE